MRLPLAAALAVLSALVCGAAADEPRIPGVIGTDDRQILSSQAPPWGAIGRVNIGGYSHTTHCTGTLIAPNLVVTAAHCLIDERTGRTVPTDQVHFLAGVRRDGYLAHARAACLHLHGRYRGAGATPQSRATYDAAVIVLADALSVPPMPLADGVPADGTALVHASYPRDRPYLLSADRTCHLKGRGSGLLLTDCDTTFGSSGGPVLTVAGGSAALIGIMIGFIPDGFSLTVPLPTWSALARNAACP